MSNVNATFNPSPATTTALQLISKLNYSKMDTPSLLKRFNNPSKNDDLTIITQLLTKRGKMPVENVETPAPTIVENVPTIVEKVEIVNDIAPIVVVTSKKTTKTVEIAENKSGDIVKTKTTTDETIKFFKLDVETLNGFNIGENVKFSNKVERHGLDKNVDIHATILYFRQKAINKKYYAKLQIIDEKGNKTSMMKVLAAVSKIEIAK